MGGFSRRPNLAFAAAWTEDPSRASPGYVVLHDERQLASITINTDLTENGEHIVRLILFLRSSR